MFPGLEYIDVKGEKVTFPEVKEEAERALKIYKELYKFFSGEYLKILGIYHKS